MIKKVEIWIVFLIFILGILFTVFFGAVIRLELLGGNSFLKNNGLKWIPETALFIAEIPSNAKKLFIDDNIIEDRFPQLEGFNGTPNSEESYLLHSRYDGNLEEGVIELINLTNFKVIHTWNPDIDKFNDQVEQIDEFAFLKRDGNNGRASLVHPKLTENGGLLFNASTLRKINSCSELVFQITHDVLHHSIETDIDGNIWVPSTLYPHSLPKEIVGKEFEIFKDDAILKLSPDGEIIFEKSVPQIFIDNGLEYLLFSVGDQNTFFRDPIHLNDIQPVNFDTDFWKKGDVFISLRHQSMIALYRPSTNKIVWKFTGPIFHQHDVDIIDDHRIAIFNNNSKNYRNGDIVDKQNEVIIYNFKTRKYLSYLLDSFSNNDVRTITEGRSEILPNGDLFIEETNYGRTLYFNKDGSLRWFHINRANNNNVYRVGWSRILYKKEDLQNVNNFLKNKGGCIE